MLELRISLLLLLEAGTCPYPSRAVNLPRAYYAARGDNLLLTRSIPLIDHPAVHPLLLENPVGSFETSAETPHFSLERKGSLHAPQRHRFLDASGSAEGALNAHSYNQPDHVEDTSNLSSREYAFTEAEAKTLRTPKESGLANITAQVDPAEEKTSRDSFQISGGQRTTGTPNASPQGEAASTTAPSASYIAEGTPETHDEYHSGQEGKGGKGSCKGGGSSHRTKLRHPQRGALETREAAPSLLPNAATFTATSRDRNTAQAQDESSATSNKDAAGESTAESSRVPDANKTTQVASVSFTRQGTPTRTEGTGGEASFSVSEGNPAGGKLTLDSSAFTDIRHAATASVVELPAQFLELHPQDSKERTTAVASDTASKQHQIAKHEAKDNQPVEKKLARQGPELSKRETQNLVDPEALAKKVRKFVGLRAGSNLHLETQKLIEKNCDISTFGPSYCASKANPNAEGLLWSLEHRKNTTCFVIALITLAFGVLVQTLIRLLENRISQGKDEFSKEVMETAFRQIATISIVNVLLWGVMQSNLASVLDQLIFGDVIPKERDSDAVLENISPMLEVLFEELFFVAVILLVWYVLYVLIFQCLTRQLIEWMRQVDEEGDIPEIARQAEIQRTRCCGWLLGRGAIDKANFIAHRYEFGDNVQAMSVPGVDPTGYYFMEYLRAALLRMAIEMIRLPNSTLIFLMFVGVCLRPVLSFRLSQEVTLISALSAVCLLGMLLVWAYVYRIERQLRPRHIPQYLVLRYHMDVGGHSESYVEQFTPPYKLQKQKDTWPGLMSILYGTTLPNKHQQLFCFWANGPALVLRSLEATFFCQLLVLAWWVQLVRNHPATWLRYCWWGNLVVGACALVQFGLLENVVYTVLVALNSGLLIEPELLEKVWDMQRAENMRLIVELTDALRVHSTLYAINEGGDIFWRQLLIRSKSAPRQAQEQRLSIWAGLDEEHQGEINREKVFRYLSSQGLPIKSEADVSDFLQVFDREGKGGLNEDEFFVLVMIVKQMLMEPLDKDALRALFENEYGIPWTSAVGVDMPTLSKILSRLHLVWSEGKKRYLFDFVGGRRGTTSVSPDQFVTSLQAMDEQAMQPFQADLTGRHADGERFS